MKNKRKNISWTWVVIGLLSLGICYSLISHNIYDKNSVPQICVEGSCFTVELARTEAEQQLGLMNRVSMAEQSGMLFIFPKADLYNFRMKNTLIPLDMIRIDEQFKVVKILTAQPCTADPCRTYNPEIGAKYVLEVNAGIAEKYTIVEGTQMDFQNIK